MFGNEEEASRAKTLAEKSMRDGDFVGAKRLLIRAQRLFSSLQSLPQMLAVCDVHSSTAKKVNGLEDWYNILQVEPSSNDDTIKKQYKKLALLLHPDKNHFPGAEAAFKLIQEANTLLTDKKQRKLYDGELNANGAPLTYCEECGIQCEVLKQNADKHVICPSCLRNAEPKLVYMYPIGTIQGPFVVSDIIRWFEEGYFETDLMVRFADAPEGTPFQELGSILTYLKTGESVHAHMSTSKSVPDKDLSLKL